MINYPIWGNHPHFKKFEIDDKFTALCENYPDVFDNIEITIETNTDYKIDLSRNPLPFETTYLPDGKIMLPDTRLRRSLLTLDEMDRDHSLRCAIQEYIAALPYNFTKQTRRGHHTLNLKKDGASLQINAKFGKILIYSEGRHSAQKPYWINKAQYYPAKTSYTYSDILVSGGLPQLALNQMISDENIMMTTIPKFKRYESNDQDSIFYLDFDLDFFQ